MLPSTWLAFTKSCRLNFSTSGSSSIGDGGQRGKRESGRRTSDYCSWYDHGPGVGVAPPAPKRRQATGTVSLEFLPRGGGVNHTIAYLRLVHPVHRACEFLHAQRQVLVQVQMQVELLVLVQMQVELLVLLKNKKQNPQYMYMQLDKDI